MTEKQPITDAVALETPTAEKEPTVVPTPFKLEPNMLIVVRGTTYVVKSVRENGKAIIKPLKRSTPRKKEKV